MKATIVYEPSYKKAEPASQSEIAQALTWYNQNMDEKEAAKVLKCDIRLAKNHATLAWVTRIQERGFILPEISLKHLAELRERFAKATPVVSDDDETPTPVINIQERIEAKTDHHIGELEGMVDQYGLSGKPFNAYEWFSENDVKPVHANRIADYFRERAKNLLAEVQSKDLSEAYDSLGKRRVTATHKVMTGIVQDAERLSQNVNKARKPRKRKAIAADKVVANLNYKEKDESLKIQSVNPESILGCQQLWIFNTKTRRLALFIASDAGGIMVKGSTLKNFNEDTSFSKTVRKPEKVLESVLSGGKVALRKVMDGIRSKQYKLNGRVNKDTVLLRAIH